MRWLLLLWCAVTFAQSPPPTNSPCSNSMPVLPPLTYLDFVPERRVPLDVNGVFTYNLWHWQFNPNTNQILVYTNGVLNPALTEANGTANINLVAAWTIQPNANSVKIGVIDDFTVTHGHLVRSIIEQITRSTNIQNFQTDYTRFQTAVAFTNAVDAGCRLINYSSGDTQNPKPTNMLASIARAGESNVLVIVPALNGYGEEDRSRDWIPIEQFPHVLTVNSFDKEGRLWASAFGTNVFISAPGRRVLVFDGTNAFSSSGTCHATAHQTGAAALVMARYLDETWMQTIERFRKGADLSDLIGTNACGGTLNVYRALVYNPYAPYLIVDSRSVSLSVPTNQTVNVSNSSDLISWTLFATNLTGDGFPHPIAAVSNNVNQFYKL